MTKAEEELGNEARWWFYLQQLIASLCIAKERNTWKTGLLLYRSGKIQKHLSRKLQSFPSTCAHRETVWWPLLIIHHQLNQYDGVETWDIESVRTLVGGGSLYIIKQVSLVKQW